MEKEKYIADVINERKKIPSDVKNFISLNVFFNVIMAIIMLVSTLVINITFSKVNVDVFKSYIHVFQMVLAVITIIFFETAYKKDSFLISFYGIEMFVFSLTVMFVPHMYISKEKFNYLIILVSLYTVYYVFKSILTAIYLRNNYIKNNISDVKEIVKDEKKGYLDEESKKTLRENKKMQEEASNNKKKKTKQTKNKTQKKKEYSKENLDKNIKKLKAEKNTKKDSKKK